MGLQAQNEKGKLTNNSTVKGKQLSM
jgi:hypothetical protein